MDLSDLKVIELFPQSFIPAPAQGVLGLQIREEDKELRSALSVLHDEEVASQIAVERKILQLMEGGCQLPLGVYCVRDDGDWVVYTSYAASKEDVANVKSFHAEDTDGFVDMIVRDLKNGQ